MKVILLQDVSRIGQKHEVKDVPSGHALNYLIPQKLAEPATPQSLKRLQAVEEKRASLKESSDEAFQAALATLKEKTITLSVEANEKGHLFQGIKAEDVAKHLHEEGIDIAASALKIEEPIKEVGEKEIAVAQGEASGSFTLIINAKTA